MAAGLLCTQACDSIDDLSGGADAPEVTYGSTTYEADFYEPGNSSVPSIDWNGAQGTVSLGSNIEGLSVNSTTGQLQWTKLLPPGTHEVEVVVANSEGQVVVPISINNPLAGSFAGTIYENDDPYDLAIDFNADGTAIVVPNTFEYTGTYVVQEDDSVLVNLVRSSDSFKISLLGQITQTASHVTYSGNYYLSHDADPDEKLENFTVDLE